MKNTESNDDTMSRIICKWKDQLEAQYFALHSSPANYRRVYICSPCAGTDVKELKRNILCARFFMWYALENMNVVARAPHAYLPVLLNDNDPAERALALRFGLQLLEQSDALFVCGNRLSTGMRGEITRAAELNIPITVFHPDLYVEVRKLVTRAGGDKGIVERCCEDTMLHLSPGDIFGE